MEKQKKNTTSVRPPVIVIMGHIDHGKSTLLDYIRKTNVVDTETGGITQHLSAYEVKHKDESGTERKMTFLDTPGHEAFQKMRMRGAEIADIAVLIVSAEDGVKAQTLEAYASIKKTGIPYIVAINKIDKPNADIEKTKNNLLENEIYLEGSGGKIPWVAISAKQGTGISELLDMMLLVADLEELSGDHSRQAEGLIIEADLDPRKGISTTLVIRNGTIKSGEYLVSGNSISPIRILEDFQGKSMKESTFSSPVRVIGWSKMPTVGDPFTSFKTKKEAEQAFVHDKDSNNKKQILSSEDLDKNTVVIPIILKADVVGSLDAIEHELSKLEKEKVVLKIIQKGVGAISENDVKIATGSEGTVVVGFNTNVDRAAQGLADRIGIEINTFDIIYKLSEWMSEVTEKRRPKIETEEITARAKILKNFSRTKNKQVIGARVESGTLYLKNKFRILRQETEIGRGTVHNLQQQKVDAKEVYEGSEFGAQLNSEIEIAPGDYIESYTISKK